MTASKDAHPATSEGEDRDWLTRTLLPEGAEPDPRFTLANERTFLAWIRTSLAFLAGGLAINIFPFEGISRVANQALSVAALAVAVLVAASSALRWLTIERAMRVGKPLPAPKLLPIVALTAVLGCVVGLFISLA